MTRFSRAFFVGLAALAVAVACTTAEAQPQRGGQRAPGGRQRGPGVPGMMGRPGGGVSLFLLFSPQVREELNLSEKQVAQIQQIMEEARGQRPERRPGGQDLSEEERRKLAEERQERTRKLLDRIRNEVLEEPQAKRLGQIMLWVEGPWALMNENLIAALQITSEQRQQIQNALEQFGEGMRGLRDLDPEKRGPRMAELRKVVQGKIMQILTDEQKGRLKQEMGERFELQGPQGMFGRGGGRPGARGGGRGPEGQGGGPPRKKQRPQ